METKIIIAMALIISAVLLGIKVFQEVSNEQFREGKYIHIDSVVIEFNKSNANVYVKYRLSPFAEVYIFLFGSKHLEPKIKEIFADLGNVKILKIGSNSASLLVSNISQKNDKFYLHESRKLDMQPDILTLVYPDGTRRNILNTNSTPNTFYT
jgi:hypothetical protein